MDLVSFFRMLWAIVLRLFGLGAETISPPAPLTPSEVPTEPPTPIQDPPSVEIPIMPQPPASPPTPVLTRDISNGALLAMLAMGKTQGWDPRNWLAVSAFESGGVHAGAKNPKGAYGLIQFTEAARGVIGWPTARPMSDIASLTAEEQIPLVARYYQAHAPITSPGEAYAFTFLPAAIQTWGRGKDWNLAYKDPSARLASEPSWDPRWGSEANVYAQNASLDANHDGKISVSDLTQTALRATETMGARWNELMARLAWFEKNAGGSGSSLPIGPIVALAFAIGLGVAIGHGKGG